MGIWAILGIGAAVVALMMSQKKPTKALAATTTTAKARARAKATPAVLRKTKVQVAPAIPYTKKEKAVVAKVMKSKLPPKKKAVIAKLAQVAASPPTVTSKVTRAKAKKALEVIKAKPATVNKLTTAEKVVIAQSAIETMEPTPKEAAEALRIYLAETKSWGWKGRPDPTVKRSQSLMGGLTADGIYGPKTRTRAKELGVNIPPRS